MTVSCVCLGGDVLADGVGLGLGARVLPAWGGSAGIDEARHSAQLHVHGLPQRAFPL